MSKYSGLTHEDILKFFEAETYDHALSIDPYKKISSKVESKVNKKKALKSNNDSYPLNILPYQGKQKASS